MDRKTRDRVIELSARIQRLREESQRIRDELRAAEADLDGALIGETSESSSSHERTGQPHERTIASRVMAVLRNRPDHALGATDIAKLIGSDQLNIPTVRATLARLRKALDFTVLGRILTNNRYFHSYGHREANKRRSSSQIDLSPLVPQLGETSCSAGPGCRQLGWSSDH